MSRIFFAWELGQNFGHLSRLSAIASHLRARGHEVFFAVRDCSAADAILQPLGITFVQAPFWHSGGLLNTPPANYAELLLGEGYGCLQGLRGEVHAWTNLYRLYGPDIVVIDHAPTALLAACIMGCSALQIGSGFAIPPDRCPFPSIRPWQAIATSRLLQAEYQVLQTINRICREFNHPGFDSLQRWLRQGTRLLTSFPRLDHYGTRADETYIGPIFTASRDVKKACKDPSRVQIFAYLRPSIPGFPALLQALVDLTAVASVTLVAPGIEPRLAAEIVSPDLQLYRQPIDLTQFCSKAVLAVTYGNFGTVNQFLLAGVPLLMVPQNVEQYLFSKRVQSLGAGLLADQRRSVKDFSSLLQRLLEQPDCRQRAAAFARGHAGYRPEQAVQTAVTAIESAAGCATDR